MKKKPQVSLQNKLAQIDRRIRTSDLKVQIEKVIGNNQDKINALMGLAKDIKGSELEGLPYSIALMKSNFVPEEEIADQLEITVRDVRNISKKPGFLGLINQMQASVWSDLLLVAQATIRHHIEVEKNMELAKWLLESTGQVASSRPISLHQHNNKTLVMGQGGGAVGSSEVRGNIEGGNLGPAELYAEEMFNRMSGVKRDEKPPIQISG